MKKLILPALLGCCCNVFAQTSTMDNYFTGTNTFKEIATAAEGITNPHDLDFVPGRPNELWILSRETNGGSVVILFNAGKSNQVHQFRKDSHHEHFMARTVAMAFGANDYFGSAQEIKSTASASSTFMGPALWSSDTAIFARLHQSNWDPNMLLGSHIDMLHQSPYGMGIAHDSANVYWYFDGYSGNICRYDFATPHGVGEDDHSDGRIYRYTDVTVTRTPNIPSHMVMDKANRWLYYIDGGTNKVMRLKTNSGTVGATLAVPATSTEPLGAYKEVTGATKEDVVTSGITKPCGIDYRDGRIVVSDNTTGNLYVYNVTGSTPALVGTLITGGPGVMGVKIDDNNRIWYVNKTTKKVYRIDNPNVLGVDDVAQNLNYSVYPNPATNVLNISVKDLKGNEPALIRVFDVVGRQVFSASANEQLTTINTGNWAKGMYTVAISTEGTTAVSKVVIQ
jgi:hypothetical protein